MKKRKEIKELKLASIQYVHDPGAAEKWFELCTGKSDVGIL